MPDEQQSASINLKTTSRVVAAYVRRNQIGSDLLPQLISSVHSALEKLGQQSSEVAIERIPAVTVRRSVQRSHVVCLDCGWKGQMLKRHLTTAHELSVEAYRARWKLARDHAMTAPAYSERRSGLAKQAGLGHRASATENPITATQPSVKERGRGRTIATMGP